MNEVLFRGWHEDSKQWVFGYLFKNAGKNGNYYILNGALQIGDVPKNTFRVNPESVGQFTGLDDSKKRKLFSGDIILAKGKKSVGDYVTSIVFADGAFKPKRNDTYFIDSAVLTTSLKLGNIFENPELLGEV